MPTTLLLAECSTDSLRTCDLSIPHGRAVSGVRPGHVTREVSALLCSGDLCFLALLGFANYIQPLSTCVYTTPSFEVARFFIAFSAISTFFPTPISGYYVLKVPDLTQGLGHWMPFQRRSAQSWCRRWSYAPCRSWLVSVASMFMYALLAIDTLACPKFPSDWTTSRTLAGKLTSQIITNSQSLTRRTIHLLAS